MKTKVFTFILLALIMISYSSCSSDEPFKEDTELTESEKANIVYTVQQSIQGGTFRCEALNSELYFKPSTKSTFISYELRGDIVNPEWFPDGYATGPALDVNHDYTISSRYMESMHWKVSKDFKTLEGLHEFVKGTWKRIK